MILSENRDKEEQVSVHMVIVGLFTGSHRFNAHTDEKTWRPLLDDKMMTREHIYLC